MKRPPCSETGAGARNSAVGNRGEEIAVLFLKGLKYRILERNYRCRSGEIDIIARDGRSLVFVEVKARRHAAFGPPQMAVTAFKQRQISKAALTWLAQNSQENAEARFDVVAVTLPDHEVPQIEHIRCAFDLCY
ncbi:MAG TPA: YraN family protein [Verrucomicrobiae bacterium]|nr:YraN family protein [Verrucomicrobiae bacterium]